MRTARQTTIALWILLAGPTADLSGQDFYHGKTLRVIVGFPAGSRDAEYARLIARHLGKHIPGNPDVVVENVPGGSLAAANAMAEQAESDGLSVWIWKSGLVLRQVLGDENLRFDARRLGWIGSPGRETPVCAVMGFTGHKTFDDMLDSRYPVRLGGLRQQATISNELPRILNDALGTNLQVISGFGAGRQIILAMEAEELDGVCWSWEELSATANVMLRARGEDRLTPVAIHRNAPDPEVKDLPRLPDLIRARAGSEQLALYQAWVAPYEFMRPLVAPPETPAPRLATLRQALRAALDDPALRAEAERSRLPVAYVSPDEVESHVGDLLSIPSNIKESLQFLLPAGGR